MRKSVNEEMKDALEAILFAEVMGCRGIMRNAYRRRRSSQIVIINERSKHVRQAFLRLPALQSEKASVFYSGLPVSCSCYCFFPTLIGLSAGESCFGTRRSARSSACSASTPGTRSLSCPCPYRYRLL
jgi:hypothetical protein